MNEDLRRRYVRDLVCDLEQVGGARFEQWIKPLWDDIAGEPVLARGSNVEGMPVSGEYDACWPDGSGSEASSDKAYFVSPFTKAKNDVDHVLESAPDTRKIRLFSTRKAQPGRVDALRRAVTKCHGDAFELDVWDGRRIAEYIVDRLLMDERYVERVGSALPNLQRIAEQNASCGLVPRQGRGYGGREVEETEIKRRLQTSEYIVLWGLSGVGKTEVAVAVANALRDEFHMVMWVTASDIQSIQELSSLDVRNNGYRHNINGLLKRDHVLLILDDVTVDLDLDELASACGASRTIVTSQAAFGPETIEIGFVSREQANRILSSNLSCQCPTGVVDRALRLFGGHPLVLGLLNRQATTDGHWSTVEHDFQQMLGDTTANRETAAKRLLARHLSAVGPELGFFSWCGGSSVDAGFFQQRFGSTGVRKLSERAMTVPAQDDVVKLHELVFSAVGRLLDEAVLTVDEARFEADFEDYITKTAYTKGLPFFRVVNRHRDLIKRLLENNPRPGALRYAYLHGHKMGELRTDLLGAPESDIEKVRVDGCERMAVLSLMEEIELDYRRAKSQGLESAETTLEHRLDIYDKIAGEDANDGIRDIVRHHRAKTLLKLHRNGEARDEFRTLVDSAEVRFQARLQVARLSEDDPRAALDLIVSIIEAERNSPGTVAMSVLLETFTTLRRKFLRPYARDVAEKYRQYMAQQIKAAACSGEDHPIRTFAAVGVDWAYTDESLFMDVLQEIDIGRPIDAADDGERVAIGRVLVAAGKRCLREGQASEANAWFEDADSFYSAIQDPNPFARTQHADAVLLLGKADRAEEILEVVPEHEREPFWRLRRSEVHRAKEEDREALTCIGVALQDDNLGAWRATFLELQGEVLFNLRDLRFRESFREAVQVSDNERNTDRLARRREELERQAANW
ncbi:MAG: NB-ARC domain-containing protein [Deltaproteobacteria bacterium]|nr:NB-ARC domain-containing protein [Deltaproteobacteria bacterium]